MATATQSRPNTVNEYVRKLADLSPKEALELAIQETERQQAIAAQKAEEYRSMSEIEFDDKGRICKATMGGLWRLAQMYAGSAIVPEQYRNRPHDCFIACQMAFRLKVDPFAYMQSSYVVHGRPGLEAKLAIAMLNTSGKIKGRVKYREEKDKKTGKTIKCQAVAIDADTGEEVEATVDWEMVTKEGWAGKNGSKWMTIPDQMFRYRSATFLIRAFYPEVLMGMDLADELEDVAEPAANGNGVRTLDALADRLTGGPMTDEGLAPGELTDTEAAAMDAEEAAGKSPADQFADCTTREQVIDLHLALTNAAGTNEEATGYDALRDAAYERLSPKGKTKQTELVK